MRLWEVVQPCRGGASKTFRVGGVLVRRRRPTRGRTDRGNSASSRARLASGALARFRMLNVCTRCSGRPVAAMQVWAARRLRRHRGRMHGGVC